MLLILSWRTNRCTLAFHCIQAIMQLIESSDFVKQRLKLHRSSFLWRITLAHLKCGTSAARYKEIGVHFSSPKNIYSVGEDNLYHIAPIIEGKKKKNSSTPFGFSTLGVGEPNKMKGSSKLITLAYSWKTSIKLISKAQKRTKCRLFTNQLLSNIGSA